MEVLQVKRLKDKVVQNINENNLVRTQRIIVGLSGGPDSVCLLHVMNSLSQMYGYKLYPAHLNHMLRGDEADRDEQFCEEFCTSFGLSLKVWHKDIGSIAEKTRRSVEEAARDVRYSLFREYADSLGGALIAVAHNMNDQAETVLMRIIRGTGLDGLKGMEFYRDGIIRPLLSVPRVLIEDYNKAVGIVPKIDSTNLVTDYTRNKVRLKLLPDIKELFDIDAVDALYRLSQTCNEDTELISFLVEKEYTECILEKNDIFIKLSLDRLNSVPKPALGRVIRRTLDDFSKSLKGIEHIHIEQVKKLVQYGKTGSQVQLPGKIRIYKDYSFIKVFKEVAESIDISNNFSVRITHQGEYALPNTKKLNIELINVEEYKKEASKLTQRSLVQFFDFNSIKDSADIRFRQAGDIFFPFGSSGSKKLKEFLIDEKVPKEQRDKLLLLADGREIIWIIGMRTNEKYKVNNKTIKVVKLEVV